MVLNFNLEPLCVKCELSPSAIPVFIVSGCWGRGQKYVPFDASGFWVGGLFAAVLERLGSSSVAFCSVGLNPRSILSLAPDITFLSDAKGK